MFQRVAEVSFFQVDRVPATGQRVWTHLGRMLRAIRTRRVLAELDPRLLKDIGVSRADALAEASRMPWDLGPRRYR